MTFNSRLSLAGPMHPFAEHAEQMKSPLSSLPIPRAEEKPRVSHCPRGLPLRRVTKEKFDSGELFTARLENKRALLAA